MVYAEGPRPLNFVIVRDSAGVWLQASNGTTPVNEALAGRAWEMVNYPI